MRKFLSLLFAITCIDAAAQMEPDSSVVIMAHWTKGDVVEYRMTETSYTVAGTDTTNCKTAISKLAFKVQKRAKDSYKICLKINAVDKKDRKKNTKILFTTDIYGRILDITNLEKISSDRKKMSDVSAIRDSISKYLNIFSFHGTRMKLGEDYDGEMEIESFIPGFNQPVKASTNIYLDPDHTNDSFAVARMAVYTEEESLLKGVAYALTNIASAKKAITEQEKIAYMSYQQYMSLQVHLKTGWPIVCFFDKFIEATDGEGIRSTKVQSEHLEFVL